MLPLAGSGSVPGGDVPEPAAAFLFASAVLALGILRELR